MTVRGGRCREGLHDFPAFMRVFQRHGQRVLDYGRPRIASAAYGVLSGGRCLDKSLNTRNTIIFNALKEIRGYRCLSKESHTR